MRPDRTRNSAASFRVESERLCPILAVPAPLIRVPGKLRQLPELHYLEMSLAVVLRTQDQVAVLGLPSPVREWTPASPLRLRYAEAASLCTKGARPSISVFHLSCVGLTYPL